MRLAWRLFACSTIFVTGCSVTHIAYQDPVSTPVSSTPVAATAFGGRVHGGPPQAPIVGAHVYLFAVTTGTTVGQASSSRLISGPDTTKDASGNYYVSTVTGGRFTVGANDYNCGAGGVPEQVYLYSSGGVPGNGHNNTAAGLMAVLGTCTSKVISPTPPATVQMNEVTTIAAAYALAGFASGPTAISGVQSGSTQGLTGLANAIATAGLLANISSGTASAPGINGTTVQQTINSLANSLAVCVNATAPTDADCQKLLPYAGNASDTAQAAINIARTGGGTATDVHQIWLAAGAYQQFSNALNSEPHDWTLAITYSGNLNGAQDVAIDSGGNVYVTEYDANQVDKFTPSGGTAANSPFTDNGLDQPDGVAVDGSDNVWIANWGNDEISGFTSNGSPASHSPFTNAALNNSFNLAIDGTGNIWSTNFSNSNITEFNTSGILLFNSTTRASNYGGLNGPDGIAIEAGTLGDIWVTNADGVTGTTVSRFADAGASTSTYYVSGLSAAGLDGPISDAIDAQGQVWASNYGGSFSDVSGSSITRIASNGGTSTSFTGGGVNGAYGGAYGIAIDGAGNVWTANLGVDQPADGNYIGGSISEFDKNGNALSPANGFQYGLQNPDSIAIDGSGNVWVVDNGDGTLTELVGAATPVVTPLAIAVKNSKLGQTP